MYQVSNAFLLAAKEKYQEHRIQGTIGSYSFDKSNIVSGSFHITNQCTDTSDVVLGSVYMGQLEATFIGLNIAYTNWVGKTITPTFGLKIGANTWEDIPLGVYRVLEAEHTAEGVRVVAYDNMRKFDRKFKRSHFRFSGTMLEFIAIACSDCNVVLGMDDEDIADMPNGDETVSLFGVEGKFKDFANDIETYRDLIFWIAQTLGCFATMDRLGQLVFRKYNNEVIEEINQEHRLSGAQFADYITNYTGIYVSNMVDNSESYYGYDAALLQAEINLVESQITSVNSDLVQNASDLEELEEKHRQGQITDQEYIEQKTQLEKQRKSLQKTKKQLQKRLNWLEKALAKAQSGEDGTWMELGDNPFLQDNLLTPRERKRRAVLGSLDEISYTPFSCSTVMGIHYDLGDVLYFTGGHAGEDGVFCCLMMYDWTFNGEYQMQGFGSDPSIANVKSQVKKKAKEANENALAMAKSTVGITDTSNEPYGKDGDFYFTRPDKEYYDPNEHHILWGDFTNISETLEGNELYVTAKLTTDLNEYLAYEVHGLTVGKTYTLECEFQQDGDGDAIWPMNSDYPNGYLSNSISVSNNHPRDFSYLGGNVRGINENAFAVFDYEYTLPNDPETYTGRGITLAYDTDNHSYTFEYTATASTMVIILSMNRWTTSGIWHVGPRERNITWHIKNFWTNNIPFTTMRYYDEESGGWTDLDYVAKAEESDDPDEKSGVGLVVENKVLKLKPSVMRAWFKADPPQVKRTFNQYCVRFTGKPDTDIEITLQNNNGWLNKSIKKDSEGVFTLKSGGTVSSEVIEYCAYKITGLTNGQRYYFNFKANFKDGTTFGRDFTKGLGVVFNTTGVINTDDWEGDPGTFDEENLYCSFRRGTVGTFYDFSFVATASTMYMCVVVADITNGQTSSLTLSKMVISKTERAYVRDFYIFDIVSNDWLPYKPWGSGSGSDSGASSLGDLDDVNLDNLSNGQTLYYDSTTGQWINDDSYSLPIASANTLGGIKVGNRLSIDENGVLSADDQSYTLPIASANSLGGIKVGANLSIDENGILSADAISIEELNDIGDVEITNPSNGQVLKYDSTEQKWVNGTGGGGSSDLEAIDLNQSQYNALTPAEKADLDKMYFITDGNGDGTINNWTISALAYKQLTPVQYEALSTAQKNDGTVYFVSDDAVGIYGLKVITITTAEYEQLTPEQKNNGIPYFVHD